MKKLVYAGKSAFLVILTTLVIVSVSKNALSQSNYIVPSGSYLVNMGVTPQTIGNGLKPYGMIYDLIKNYGVTVVWSINPAKGKDGIDFSHNGIDYRGGTFIIPAEYRTTAVNNAIISWENGTLGVRGATSVAPISVPLYTTYNLATIPRWTLDKDNGSIATGYFVNAGIPPDAHGGDNSNLWKFPSQLGCCDDLFVMPHADPAWDTHARLHTWNLECKGAIWAACHATSALENMVKPTDRDSQTNFLTVKDPAFKGTSGDYTLSNSLILWGSHAGGTPAYSYRLHTDPVAQFMGVVDPATQNGSEQIIMPRQGIVANASMYSPSAVARWNLNANLIVYDTSQANVTNPDLASFKNVASVMVYGRGFDATNRGYVMYQPAHSHNKGTAPANIASQRAFFNFGFLVANDKAFTPVLSGFPVNNNIASGTTTTLGYTVTPSNNYTTLWSSTCTTASAFNTAVSNTTVFTAPSVSVPTPCTINVKISDPCGRQVNMSKSVIIQPCNLTFNNTITNVSCNGGNNGKIQMMITGGSAPYTWNWSRVSGGIGGPGTLDSITGLSAGTYNVTVTAPGGCSGTFSTVISQPAPVTVSASATAVLCNGASTGAIALTTSGGSPGYTYLWSDGNTNGNRSNIPAGTYTVTATDSKVCKGSTSITVTENPGMVLNPTIQPANCFGQASGQIALAVTNGLDPKTYLWSNGSTASTLTAVSAGNFTVTVTDGNACTKTATYTIGQPSAALSATSTLSGISCSGGSGNGSVVVTPSGGTAPYNISWSGPSSGDPAGPETVPYTIPNLQPGSYNITVTDNNLCTFVFTRVVTQPTALSATLSTMNPSCPPGATPPAVNNNGTINITVSGGTGPYQYNWADLPGIDDPEDRTGLTAGTYSVTVTDSNGCTLPALSATLNAVNSLPAQPTGINK